MYCKTPYSGDPALGVTHSDIYVSLDRYGCNFISALPIGGGKVLPIETLITEILEKSTDIREVEGASIVLAANEFDINKIINEGVQKKVAQKTGYVSELTGRYVKDTTRRGGLVQLSEELYPLRERGIVPIVNGLSEKLIHSVQPGELESKWGINFGLDHSVIKDILNRKI